MDKMTERRLILWRFFQNDKRLYELGKQCGISWFTFMSGSLVRMSTHFCNGRKEAEQLIASFVDDVKFVESLNK